MQDRFKFRYHNNNKIYDVSAIDFTRSRGEIVSLDKMETLMCKLDLNNLIQCTGLKDKNGKLIYEGDLLRYPPKDKDEETNFVVCEVFFHNNDCCDTHIGFQMNRFRFHGNLCGIINFGTKYDFIPKNVEKMEVIGNKFQNKELLSEVENDT